MRRLAAGRVLAALVLLGGATRLVAGKPPSNEDVGTFRERLLAAHRSAVNVHRGYEIEVNGALWGRSEIFREGRYRGVHVERLPGVEPGRAADYASDGTKIVGRFDDRPEPVAVPSVRRGDPRTGAFEAVRELLRRMHGLEPGPRAEGEAQFYVWLPDAAGGDLAPGGPATPAAFGLRWVSTPLPSWLGEPVLSTRPQAESPTPDLVAARVHGYDALLHSSDGCIARIEGAQPASGTTWVVHEVATGISPAVWRGRIADLCRTAEGALVEAAPDLTGRVHLALALQELASAPGLDLADATVRRPVLDVLCCAAWADRPTTRLWLDAVRGERAALLRQAVPSEPPAAAAARDEAARDGLVREIQQRLLDGWDLRDAGTAGEDAEAQMRQWIADRIRLLWTEASRPSAERDE